MKKVIYTIFVLLLISNSQAQEIVNGGFENWSTEVLFENPDVWYTSNLEFLSAEANVTKVTDASSGNYAAFMGTTMHDGELNFGFVINGTFGDDGPQTGFEYVGMIDGLKCTMKYDIQPGDSATVLLVAFNQGNVVGMNVTKPVGAQNTWSEVNVDLPNSTMVDQVLVAFASSNAMEDTGVENSWIIVDDAVLTNNGVEVFDVPNGNFETWENIEGEFPEAWQSNNIIGLDMVQRSDDGFMGNSSIRMQNIYDEQWNEVINAYLSNGEFTTLGVEGGQAINTTPETVFGHYKYQTVETDTAIVYFEFWNNGLLIGDAWVPLTAQLEWTSFEMDINFWSSSTPDMFTMTAFAGEAANSVLWLDELSFSLLSAIPEFVEINSTALEVFPNPFENILNIQNEIDEEIEQLLLYSMDGKLVWQMRPNREELGAELLPVNLSHLEKGMYQLIVLTKSERITKSIAKY